MKTLVVAAHLSMFARQSCYAAMLAGCLTRPAVAHEPASAQNAPTTIAPIYKVGDTWTLLWGRSDSKPATPLVLTVVAVTEKQTTLSSSWNGGPPKEVDYDNQANMTRDGNGTTYEPSNGYLSFPMTVGKGWDFHHVRRFTSGTLDVSGHAEVVAFERVRVPAGSFDAFKIESRGTNAKQLERLYSAPFRATYWYAPSVRKIIKEDYALYLDHQVQTHNIELAAFTLAP